MSETITIYTQARMDRKTGVVTKSHPVELTEEEFMDWIEPAIPHLANILLELIKTKEETK